MKTKIKNVCKQICKKFNTYIYCEEKLTHTWVYVVIQDKETGLYYMGYNTIKDFCKYDLTYTKPTFDHAEARKYICKTMSYNEM